MKAKVTHAFKGRPDNEPVSRTVEAGEVIAGDLAAVAVKERWAVELRDEPDDAPKPAKVFGKKK